MAETTIVQAIEIMERMKVIDEGDGLETGDHDAVLEALRASRPSSEPRCEAQVHEASSFDTGDHGECPLPSRPSSEPGRTTPAGVVDRLVELVRLYRGEEDLDALRFEFATLLDCDARAPSPGEEGGLRATLVEVDEVLTEMGWHTDRGLLLRVRTALSGRADATKGGK